MLRNCKYLVLFIAFVGCKAYPQKEKTMELSKEFDLKRYMGVWYEIARFDHSFERGLVGVTATYTLRNDGKVDVLNQGYKKTLDGKLSKAKAIAKIPDSKTPRHLKVYFFLFFGAAYNILELDEVNYQYALVGSSSDKYLWILCRQPHIDPAIYKMLLDKATARGYDVSKLYLVPHK